MSLPRKIKFRGRGIIDKKWHYGYFWQSEGEKCWIKEPEGEDCYVDYQVIPQTIGQDTGLQDRNGSEIYEGDVVKSPDHDNKIVVKYGEILPSDDMTAPGVGFQFNDSPERMEIIGSIHDFQNY